MKVLFVNHYTGSGGATNAMFSLIEGLRTLGVECYVLYPRGPEGVLGEELEKRGIPGQEVFFWSDAYDTRGETYRASKITCVRNKLAQMKTAGIIDAFVEKHRIDIVQANSSYVGVLPFLKQTSARTVWHLREDMKAQYDGTFYAGMTEMRKRFRRVDRVVLVSKYLEQVYQPYLEDADRCVIYDGVEVAEAGLGDLKDHPIKEYDGLKILYGGGNNPSKGFADILLLMQAFEECHYKDYCIYAVGLTRDDFKNKLDEREFERVLRGHLVFLPWCSKDQFNALQGMVDWFFQPSAHEAFGLVTVEAMMMGIPVLGVDSGGTGELLRDGETGYLYRPKSLDSMRNCVQKILSSEDMGVRLGNQAKEHAKAHFSVSQNVESFYRLYNEVLKG